ncbi:MAG: hypothetical protein ABS81_10260 [Pseudonocardia sp. SCN 72-86]|nr:MAG: hypothetical protein ABS81_10260 [Pseudonocardia sp. SCN 72-86]
MSAGNDPQLPFASGAQRLEAVLGSGPAEGLQRARARAEEAGDPERVTVPVGLTWGWLLDRPGLSRRDRVIAMLAVDVARGSRNALRDHVRLALAEGVTSAELRELMLQLGPYTGYPATNDAGELLLDELRRVRDDAAADPGPASVATAPAQGWFPAAPVLAGVVLVVPDAHAAAAELSALVGVRSWDVATLDGDRLQLAVHGVPQRYRALRAVGTTPAGVRFELWQPITGPPAWHLQLITGGAGVGALTVAGVPAGGIDDVLRRAAVDGVDEAFDLSTDTGAALHVLDTGALLGGYRLAVVTPSAEAFDAALATGETWRFDAPDGPILPVGPFAHAGVVVADVAARTAAHARAFGRRRWPLMHLDSEKGTLTGTRYEGAPSPDAYLSSVAKVGGFQMEVIQPLGGPSRYREGFIRPRGEGVQHLFLGPVEDPEAWGDIVERLADRGRSLVTEGVGWEGAARYAYVDTLALLGTDLELVALQPGAVLDTRSAAAFTFDHDAGPR